MRQEVTFLFLISVFCASISIAASNFNCYECNYSKTGDLELERFCRDPFNKRESSTVYSKTGYRCYTSCYKLKSKVGDKTVIRRGCWDSNTFEMKKCVDGNMDNGNMQGELACCRNDLCNSASGLAIQWHVLAVTILLFCASRFW